MELSKEYLAGLFDGEGCFGFYRSRTGLTPRLDIANTDRYVLDTLCRQFGGNVREQSYTKKSWKQGYHWVVTGSRAVDLILSLEPFCVIKQEQIGLAIAFASLSPGRGKRWDREALELLDSERKWVNFKGTGRPELSPFELLARNCR